GMKVMVLFNIATVADLVNGTRGIIDNIVLDPREGNIEADEKGRVYLKYLPAMVVFRPDDYKLKENFEVEGNDGSSLLSPGQMPLVPLEMKFYIPDRRKTMQVTQRQYCLMAAYAFTHEKSQGQTIPYILVNLAKLPNGYLMPFHVYVSLSRSKGRDNIRILRDFEPHLFTRHPSEALKD
ncbi:hypothetical protein C8J56DRAFT_708473, partial [Mycena floridula]